MWNVRVRTYQDLATGYCQDNRICPSDADGDSVLLLDADTFVFADVAELFDTYAGIDVVACTNDWAWHCGYRADYIPGGPMPSNSGVVLGSSQFLKHGRPECPNCTRH